MLKPVVYLACAGALGTLSRYGLTVALQRIVRAESLWVTAVLVGMATGHFGAVK